MLFDLIELVLHLGRIAEIHDVSEVLGQQVVDRHPDVGGAKTAIVLFDVLARLDRLDDRTVGRRPADAVLFERLDQRRFRVARRRLGEVLLGFDVAVVEVFAVGEPRQDVASFACRRPRRRRASSSLLSS